MPVNAQGELSSQRSGLKGKNLLIFKLFEMFDFHLFNAIYGSCCGKNVL